jgi:hypothetical protein
MYTSYDGATLAWACARKKAYPAEDVARLSIAAILRVSPDARLRAYLCAHCSAWHVGAAPAPLPSEEREREMRPARRSRREPDDEVGERFIKVRRRRAARRRGEAGSYGR